MRKPICPDHQLDIFAPEMMHKLFAHPAPQAPLPDLPFERREEISMERTCLILGVEDSTLRRMLARGIIEHYTVPGLNITRIRYASLLAYCDGLRLRFGIPPRKAIGQGRVRDREVLPFPLDETIPLKEICDKLDIVLSSAIKLVESGHVTAYQLVDRSPWRIHRPSFAAYLESMKASVATGR